LVGYCHFYNKQRKRSEDCRIFKSLRLFNCFWKKKSDSEEDNVLGRIEAVAQEAVSNLIPQKSRVAYETTYSRFEEWRSKQKVNCINEKVMLAYFLEKSKIVKPSTLWSVYLFHVKNHDFNQQKP
jgi:hypothetical protein